MEERFTVRRFAPYVAATLALVGLALLIVKIAPVLLLIFAGIVLAAIIRTAAMPLARRLGFNQTVAVSLVALAIATLLVGGGYLFGRQVMTQTEELWNAIQVATQKVHDRIGDSPLLQRVADEIRGAASPETMNRVAKGTFTALGALVDLALVIVLGVYLAADPGVYRRGLLRLLPSGVRDHVGDALDEAGLSLRRWILGQLLAMLIVGVMVTIGLYFIGVPLAIPLGILIGVLDFVPVVGPLLGAIPGVLIAFAQGEQVAVYAVLVYVTVQFVESHFIIPIVQRRAVGLPPALSLVGIVGFGLVFGPMGVLLAMPLMVASVTLVQKLYVDNLR